MGNHMKKRPDYQERTRNPLSHQYEKVEKIGGGADGEVFLYQDKEKKDDKVALKEIYGDWNEEFGELDIMLELDSLKTDRQESHESIINLLDYQTQFPEQGMATLVLPYFPTGNLAQWRRATLGIDWSPTDTKRIPEETLWRIMLQLTGAVNFLHEHNIIHGDIKPGNVLVNAEMGPLHCVLGDFGCAVKDEKTEDGFSNALIDPGTYIYLPPEAPISRKSDVYAVSGTVHEIAIGVPPINFEAKKSEFQEAQESIAGSDKAGSALSPVDIHKAKLPRSPWDSQVLGYSKWLACAILDGLQHDPEKRPSIDALHRKTEQRKKDMYNGKDRDDMRDILQQCVAKTLEQLEKAYEIYRSLIRKEHEERRARQRAEMSTKVESFHE